MPGNKDKQFRVINRNVRHSNDRNKNKNLRVRFQREVYEEEAAHTTNGHHDNQETNADDNNVSKFTKFLIPCFCLVIAFATGYQGYLETRINTPFDNNKVVQKSGLAVPDRYWGSYRPNVYFGMKTRDPYSLVTGIMWFYPDYIDQADPVRHWCEQNDDLHGYSWVEHDGRNFGSQIINDKNFTIITSFVKKLRGSYGGDWTARISFDGKPEMYGKRVSLFLYTAVENQTIGYIKPEENADLITGVFGYTEGLGEFSIKIANVTGNLEYDASYTHTDCEGLDVIKETTIQYLRGAKSKTVGNNIEYFLTKNNEAENSKKNLLVTHVPVTIPCSIDVIFESKSAKRFESLTKQVFDTEYKKHKKLFHEKFENIFKLKHKGYTEAEIKFAKAVFSNLIGGIGYFYGSSRVLSEHTDSPVPYWKAALYTAVPSRSFFPRGFLWDEAFHGILIGTWDLDIELDIISHWFDLMNVQGWIPREQILGSEALRKVPPEFVIQKNTNANPPVFFLTLQYILKNFEEQLIEQSSRLETLARLYNRLVAWFDWFNSTQFGALDGTFRWRGRDSNNTRELNPQTLTSGLDDYPRASHPTESERHVDLRCWMAASASALVSISNLLNKPSKRFVKAAEYLYDNRLLDKYHWSESKGTYADFGLHTDHVELKYNAKTRQKERVVLKSPQLALVDLTFGYNSLFPVMLQILDPNSPRLGVILTKLRDPNLLWTDFGLRSLSKSSPLYMARNTENDPPYWRGQIWINMNYLVVRSLQYYSNTDSPYNRLAKKLYDELRTNIISNIYKEYIRTGYVWEQYNDATGKGSGCRPFTGWTSLVVLLMAEIY